MIPIKFYKFNHKKLLFQFQMQKIKEKLPFNFQKLLKFEK